MKTMHLGAGILAIATIAVTTFSGPTLAGNAPQPAASAKKATNKSVLLSVAGMH